MKRIIVCLLFFLLCLTCYSASKQKKPIVVDDEAILKASKKWDISVTETFSDSKVSGKPVRGKLLEQALKRFFDGLDYLPDNFVKATNIRNVVIMDKLKLNGTPAGGLAKGNTMVLSVSFNKHTLYHELFHIFDDTVHTNKAWCALNSKDFVYTGSAFYEADLSKKEAKKVDKSSWKRKMTPHFVSEYAMSFEFEDRAETFAAMITEGRNFKKRTSKSKIMKKKMNMIIDMTESKKLLGHNFWQKRLSEKAIE